MKKSKLSKIIIMALCLTLVLTSGAMGKILPVNQSALQPDPNMDVTIMVNSEEVEYSLAPIIVQDRILVPIRDLIGQLGGKIEWLESQNKLVVNNEKVNIELTIGETSAFVNGEKVDLEVPARLYENNTFAPLRFISEALQAEVTWLPNERTALIAWEPEIKPVEGNIKINNFTYSPEKLIVTGTARVWEANVRYEVTDENDNALLDGFTTASIGAPEWGDFDFTIDGDLSEASVLRLFTESAKDGSRMDIIEYFLKPFGTAKILSLEPGTILVEGVLDGYSQQPVQFYFAITPQTIICDANDTWLAESDLNPGDELQIWISYPGLVLESWPAQAGAGKIVKISE